MIIAMRRDRLIFIYYTTTTNHKFKFKKMLKISNRITFNGFKYVYRIKITY